VQSRLQKEFIEQEISTTSFISDKPFTLCISQCIIHHIQKYLLSVRGDTVLHGYTNEILCPGNYIHKFISLFKVAED
jgi:hypothetical protein